MSAEEDNAREALNALGVGPAAKELYVDLLRPAARETGKNLLVVAKLVTVALAPLHGMVWGIERIRDWLSAALLKRLAGKDPEQIQAPASYIAGQALVQLLFCADQEQLREMYANLLASAMNRQSAADVHPAFVHVIQQLTPDEALVLQKISTEVGQFALHQIESESDALSQRTESISVQFRKFCESAGVGAPALSDAYLDNLLRLRVLAEQQWSEGEFRPAGYTDHGDYQASVENSNGRLIELSAFGEGFLRTCISVPIV
jgi:hypothetical protein